MHNNWSNGFAEHVATSICSPNLSIIISIKFTVYIQVIHTNRDKIFKEKLEFSKPLYLESLGTFDTIQTRLLISPT